MEEKYKKNNEYCWGGGDSDLDSWIEGQYEYQESSNTPIGSFILCLVGFGMIYFMFTSAEFDWLGWGCGIFIIIACLRIGVPNIIRIIRQKKIDDEQLKKEWLHKKFNYLIKTICKKTSGKIFDIKITKPINKELDWTVETFTLDSQGDPVYEKIYTISDSELNKLMIN